MSEKKQEGKEEPAIREDSGEKGHQKKCCKKESCVTCSMVLMCSELALSQCLELIEKGSKLDELSNIMKSGKAASHFGETGAKVVEALAEMVRKTEGLEHDMTGIVRDGCDLRSDLARAKKTIESRQKDIDALIESVDAHKVKSREAWDKLKQCQDDANKLSKVENALAGARLEASKWHEQADVLLDKSNEQGAENEALKKDNKRLSRLNTKLRMEKPEDGEVNDEVDSEKPSDPVK